MQLLLLLLASMSLLQLLLLLYLVPIVIVLPGSGLGSVSKPVLFASLQNRAQMNRLLLLQPPSLRGLMLRLLVALPVSLLCASSVLRAVEGAAAAAEVALPVAQGCDTALCAAGEPDALSWLLLLLLLLQLTRLSGAGMLEAACCTAGAFCMLMWRQSTAALLPLLPCPWHDCAVPAGMPYVGATTVPLLLRLLYLGLLRYLDDLTAAGAVAAADATIALLLYVAAATLLIPGGECAGAPPAALAAAFAAATAAAAR
jgi:hypothetical protein